MKAILPNLNEQSSEPLYIQLYSYIRDAILQKEIVPDEKLPSLRNLSESLSLSLTTVETAYNQLSVEGYIYSKPKSGYYVRAISSPGVKSTAVEALPIETIFPEQEYGYLFDLTCFDFNKWKKCVNRVLNDHPESLLFEGDPQGEVALRQEISRYVFQSRGVKCHPDQVVVAAGTQQITAHLSRILAKCPSTTWPLRIRAIFRRQYLPRQRFRHHPRRSKARRHRHRKIARQHFIGRLRKPFQSISHRRHHARRSTL